jgi:putative transposase
MNLPVLGYENGCPPWLDRPIEAKEGFSMAALPNSANSGSHSFQKIVTTFLAQPGLPFANVLSAERIERIFAKHGNLFGAGAIYSTAVMVWSFLGQVLRDGKEASCQSAVARIVTYYDQQQLDPPTSDTGDYCKARGKLSEAALRDLTREVGGEVEQQADASWLWKGRHAKLVDGFTFTMPDTELNQAEYPQSKSQKKGVGLPIARAAVVLSLATACALDLAVGPYAGKETGETALLRQLLAAFASGDVAVVDRFYCSFMMIALLLGRNVQVCARMHQRRHVDFRRGRRLGKYDHLIVWTKPERPTWMDPATYEAIPDVLEMREIRYNIVQPGYRSQTITIATTLTDAEAYSKEEIAQLYGFRWNSELDIRSIKQSLNLCHVRCKSPEMVRKEVWTTLLGYNLIRITAAAAALLHDKQPRQISFTSTCQYVLARWMLAACGANAADRLERHCRQLLAQIAECEVANRPGRLEPRVLKRRRHGYKLMQEPRSVLRAKLRNG